MESGTPSLLLLLKSLMMPCLRLCKSLRCNTGAAPVWTGHIELLFYNRIITTDSAPVILSPIAVAFGLLSGLDYRIVLLPLPSTAPWFVN